MQIGELRESEKPLRCAECQAGSPYRALRLAIARGLLLGAVLAIFGGLGGFNTGLVALPLTLLEHWLNRRPPPSRANMIFLAFATWIGAFMLFAGAQAQAIYTSAILAGASLPDGFGAIHRELTRLRSTHPEDITIAYIHFEALSLGSCAIAAPVTLLALLIPRPLRPGFWTGQQGEYAGAALVAYVSLLVMQTILTTAFAANRSASAGEIAFFVLIIAGVLSFGSSALGLVAFWTTDRLDRKFWGDDPE